MIFTQNHEMNDIYSRAWAGFLSHLSNKPNPGKQPTKPGPGWLKNIAVKNNHCYATSNPEGDWIVCANPLWKGSQKDAYLCDDCSNQLKNKAEF